VLWKQESFLVQVPLVELVELLAGHRGHGSVRVLVETVQGNMLSYKSSFHEALNYDAEAAAWQRLHNDCNSCRSRFDRDVLGRLSGELLKVFEGDSSEPLAALINNFPECRKGFRKCAHRQLFNYTLRAEFFRNLLKVLITVEGDAASRTCKGETIFVNLHGASLTTTIGLSVGMRISIHVFLTDKRAAAPGGK
jgi:hypothetical protein